jgi:pimeloyl-ACP methyl ester carboxylesterase
MHAGSAAGGRCRASSPRRRTCSSRRDRRHPRGPCRSIRAAARKLLRHPATRPDGVFHGWHDTGRRPSSAWTSTGWAICDLVIQGEGDQYGTQKQLDAIAERASGPVETLMLPDCGHSPHRDRRDEVLAVMTRFIRNLPRG